MEVLEKTGSLWCQELASLPSKCQLKLKNRRSSDITNLTCILILCSLSHKHLLEFKKNVNASCSGRCCTPSQHGWSRFPAVSATVPAGTPSHLSQWQPLPVFHPNVSCGFFPFQITIFPGKKNPHTRQQPIPSVRDDSGVHRIYEWGIESP